MDLIKFKLIQFRDLSNSFFILYLMKQILSRSLTVSRECIAIMPSLQNRNFIGKNEAERVFIL